MSGHEEIKLSSPKFSCTYLKYSLTLTDETGLGQSIRVEVGRVSQPLGRDTNPCSGTWKHHFHVPPLPAGTISRNLCQVCCTVEVMLTKDLEEDGPPQNLIISRSHSPAMIPHRPSSKRKIFNYFEGEGEK